MTRDEAGIVLEEIAARVIGDPSCNRCERMAYSEAVKAGYHPSELRQCGWSEMFDFCGYVRYCDPCKTRKPFTWVLKIDPARFAEWAEPKRDTAWLIDDLKVLVPFEDARGSSRFEWL